MTFKLDALEANRNWSAMFGRRALKLPPFPLRKFDPDQARDEAGRWTDGGGGLAPKFDKESWGKMGMSEARKEWSKLSTAQQDAMASAPTTIRDRIAETTGRAAWSNTGDMRADISARVASVRDNIATHEAAAKIESEAVRMYDGLRAAGADEESAREITRMAADALIAQDYEAAGRSLSDHGIFHIQQNTEFAIDVLRKMPGGMVDQAKAESMIRIASAFHDSGYLTPPSQAFLDSGHPRWSAQYYRENVKDAVAKALGQDAADQIQRIIGGHDRIDLDWEKSPLASAYSLADNTALFHAEKMPMFIRDAPNNAGVLIAYARGKIDLEQARVSMHSNIDAQNLSSSIKAQMHHAVTEVGPMLPKYTLGMLGTKLNSVTWEKSGTSSYPALHLTRLPSNEALSKVLDVGQTQFAKLAETYKYDAKKFIADKAMTLTSGGRVVMSADISEVLKLLMSMLKFDPDQPRDDNGQWTDGGGATIRSSEKAPSNQGFGRKLHSIAEAQHTRFTDRFESAYNIGPDGYANEIGQGIGDGLSVQFTENEIEALRGNVLTHNHPDGYALSALDLSFAAYAGVKEIRAVGTDATGQKWLFRAWPGDNGWGNSLVPDQIRNEYKSYIFENQQLYWKQKDELISQGAAPEQAAHMAYHSASMGANEHVAKEFGYNFEAVKL